MRSGLRANLIPEDRSNVHVINSMAMGVVLKFEATLSGKGKK